MLKEKTKAPDFELMDQNNKLHTLADYKGKWVIVYFYPRDNSPGCTTEAKNFRDNIEKFEKLNAKVIGISPDSPISHKRFADKYNLPIILLSDPEKEVIKKYYAGGIITKRVSYLINPEGIVEKVYPTVNPARHAEDIINDLENLNIK
ncbi:MAG: peroxiredoxin [Actinobacteria bacterium]|nr:peroxiredoxin [Actinomycetota bacterium]MCL5069443.1 peroxiredoxin [Actinomycetota bacterium]